MTNEELSEKKDMDIFVAKRDIAIEENKDHFYIYGQLVLVSYAKYVIENYENKKGISYES